MTRANAEQSKFVPWFAKAGAACSIVPVARFVSDNFFALKGGGYGCLFSLTGVDEEGLTDQELESQLRMIEGSLRGLPEGACLYQYTRVRSGYDLPRQLLYENPVTHTFVTDRLEFLEKTAARASASERRFGQVIWIEADHAGHRACVVRDGSVDRIRRHQAIWGFIDACTRR
jgi:type IV secretion system protein VirB4